MANTEKKKFKLTEINSYITCRQVLNLMVILGFMLNYALRLNMTMAIVSMVMPITKVDNDLVDAIFNGNSTIPDNITLATIPASSNVTQPTEVVDTSDKFQWDEYQQNIIHGSFYWGYILTELPGGRLAELIGGRRVFGHSMLWASVFTALMPFGARLHYVALIILRVLLGFMLGASWPAIHPMTAVWIPPMDRSKFMSNMMASSLGAAITMPVCGYLIAAYGWASAFYVTGILGIVWSLAWFFLIFETPADHPRISQEEKSEIEDAIGTTTSKTRPSYVPWAQMLSAPCVWAIVVTHGCSVFGYYTVVNQLPTYMSRILGYNIKENGLFSSLPYLGKYLMAITASYLADYLRRTGKLTTTVVRKLFTAFAILPPGILMIAQVYMGWDKYWSVAIFTIALTLNGAVTGGYLGNGLDIAPNFSGTIFGMANTLSSIGGFLSTYMVGTLTYQNQQYSQWQIIFGILAGTYIGGSIVYTLFGSGDLQDWNNPPERKKVSDMDAEEGVPLKTNKSLSA